MRRIMKQEKKIVNKIMGRFRCVECGKRTIRCLCPDCFFKKSDVEERKE